MPAAAKKKILTTVLLTIAGVLLFSAAGGVAVAYSGTMDVAATNRPSGVTRWFLTTTRDHSIADRARTIEVPSLEAPGMLEAGAEHYREMCVTCHGAPGHEAGEAALGLEPPPPELPTQRSDAEAFWIVKNGIQTTGMPAFGKTHDDKQIWAMIAFVKRLRGMSPAEYQERVGAAGGGDHEEHAHAHDHAHDD